jgi:hypothetical protein
VDPGQEIELAAKSTGAVVGAVLEASGATQPMQEVTGWLASWMHPRLVASAAKQTMAAVAKLERAGIRPGAVRDEQMRTLLEEGAREEDDGLKEKWANLLANGLASGDDGVPRAYAEVLRQLEPVEVLMLDGIAGGTLLVQGAESGTRMARGEANGIPLKACVNLERLGVMELWHAPGPPNAVQTPSGVEALRLMRLTQFGISFVEACREPGPQDA